MTRFVGTPLRGIEFANAGDEAISVRVISDSQARVRIDAGGRITWSSGSAAGDTVLFRDAANYLKTEDAFEAEGGLITITTDGSPSASLPDGALAIDTTNNVFYFRSNSTWNQVTGGGGGASVTVSETAPVSPSEGDLWYESDTGAMFVYFDSVWVEVSGGGGGADYIANTIQAKGDLIVGSASAEYTRLPAGTNGYFLKANSSASAGLEWAAIPTINALDDIGDVSAPTPSSGDFLKWNGTAWVNDAIDLGTDTTGSYVQSLVAGTNVSITNNSGEGSTPTISITGNIGNFDSIGTPDYIQFDTTVGSPTASAGALQYDSDFGALSFGLPGADAVVQIGFNNFAYCYNQDSVTITKGTPVYISGGQGSQVGIQRAYNTSDAGSARTLGLVAENIPAGESGYVITYGVLPGIDTSAYSLGQILYLGATPGTITTTKPQAPNHYVFIGVVVKADVGGEIWLRPQNGYELDEIHDVRIVSPQNGDYIRYNSASALWVNDQINLGTDTVGNYVVDVSGGTGVTVTHTPSEGSTPTIAIGQDVGTSASVQFSQVTTTGDITVGGNLTVSGTTTTVNTETVLIADNIITLNSNETSTPTENAGIEVERGTSTNVQIRWNETTDKWQFTNDGSAYVDLGAGGATVSASAPATGDAGSLWLDSINLDLYVRYDDNWVQLTGEDPVVEDLNDLSDVNVPSPNVNDVLVYDGTYWTSASASGGASIEVSASAPATPTEGALWFDSNTAATYIYYDSSWVEIGVNDNAAKAIVSASAPAAPAEGEMWFNSEDARTYTYYDGTWIELGASGFGAFVGASAPASPQSGQFWFDSDTGATYVYYDSVWIEVGATPPPGTEFATTGKAIAMAIVFSG